MTPDDAPLDPSWIAWITENLLRGAPPDDVVTALVDRGLSAERAAREVAAIDGSPILAGARRLVARSAGVEQAARLVRGIQGTAPFEVSALDDAGFFTGYVSAHRPVVLRGGAADWPAISWTHAGLAADYGAVEVEVLRGRSRQPRWWMSRDALRCRIPFAELLGACLDAPGDDLYAVGRNDLLSEPGLAPLWADLGSMPGCSDEASPRLWVGPAGTRTPLHHDQSSAWLVQVEGTKRVWLASPLEPALISSADGVFNRHDPQDDPPGEAAEVQWWCVDLAEGDAVYLPVGWWHQVVATTPSISVSLGGLRWPHVFPWYHPGR